MWIDFNKLEPCGECHLRDGEVCDICGRKNNPASPFDDVCDDGYRYVGKGKCPSRRSNICTAVAIVVVPLLVGCWLVWML